MYTSFNTLSSVKTIHFVFVSFFTSSAGSFLKKKIMWMNFIRTRHPGAHTRTQSAHGILLTFHRLVCAAPGYMPSKWTWMCTFVYAIQCTSDCCIDFRLIAAADTVIIKDKCAIYIGKNILRTKKQSMEHSSSHKVLLWTESHLQTMTKARTQFSMVEHTKKKRKFFSSPTRYRFHEYKTVNKSLH